MRPAGWCSDNELRSTHSLEAWARGELATGAVRHELSFGAKRIRYEERYEPMQAYNWVGISNVFAPVTLPADPTPTSLNTLRESNTTEFHFHDATRFGRGWSLWIGARHARLTRASERTDGSEATRYAQSFTTPWAALGWQPWAGGFAYLSAGSGVETEVVPNRPDRFVNHGVVLPALRSRQVELGFKQALRGAGLVSATRRRSTGAGSTCSRRCRAPSALRCRWRSDPRPVRGRCRCANLGASPASAGSPACAGREAAQWTCPN